MDEPKAKRNAAEVVRLRGEATALLHDAARCRDPQEGDQLTREPQPCWTRRALQAVAG